MSSPMDYTEDAWTAYRDVETNNADAESDGQAPTNTFGLLDNCYYVTVARLAGKTADELIRDTEQMQIAGGAPLDQIAALFGAAGLVFTSQSFGDSGQVEAAVMDAAGGFDCRGGLAYTRPAGTGHMIVVAYDAMAQQVQYLDYQRDPNGEDVKVDVQGATGFYLFFPVVPRR